MIGSDDKATGADTPARSATSTPELLSYSSSSSGRKIRGLRWYVAGLLMLATTVNYLDRQTLSVAAPVIRHQLHITNEQYSYILNGFLIAYGIMHPISGRIIDWLGTRIGFALCVTWWSIANIAHAFAGGVRSLTAMRFLLGIGEAGNFPAAIKSVSEWFPPQERAVATGILNMGAGAGAVIAPPLVGWIILRWGWQEAFVVTGSVGFLWMLLWLWLYHHPDRHPWLTSSERNLIHSGHATQAVGVETGKGTWREVLSRGDLWVLMAARFVADPVWWFYLFWLPSYLSDVRHFSLAQIAMSAWVPYLAADFGSLAGGSLSALFSRRGLPVLTSRKLAMCICAAMMPITIFAARAHSPYTALFFVSIATTGHQAWAASLLTLPADLFPKRAVAFAYGFTGMAGVLGGVVFTQIVGRMVDHLGYTPVFTVVGFLHPIAAVIVVLFVRARKPAIQLMSSVA